MTGGGTEVEKVYSERDENSRITTFHGIQMRLFDIFLSEFWLYRKIRGGMFYRIAVVTVPQLGTFWVRRTIGRPEYLVEEVCY